MHICMCVCVPNSSTRAGCDARSIFQMKFYRLEFRVFFLLDWWLYQGQRVSLPYYLSISGGKILGFILFP